MKQQILVIRIFPWEGHKETMEKIDGKLEEKRQKEAEKKIEGKRKKRNRGKKS